MMYCQIKLLHYLTLSLDQADITVVLFWDKVIPLQAALGVYENIYRSIGEKTIVFICSGEKVRARMPHLKALFELNHMRQLDIQFRCGTESDTLHFFSIKKLQSGIKHLHQQHEYGKSLIHVSKETFWKTPVKHMVELKEELNSVLSVKRSTTKKLRFT